MSPSLSEAAATFLAVLPAELPDKTILATLILSSRYRPGTCSPAPPPGSWSRW